MADVWLGPPGRVQHVDKHGGGPVDGGALLCLYGRHAGRPVEAGAGDDRGGAVDETSERGTDVTEAVIEGDGDTDSVRLERKCNGLISFIVILTSRW